MKQRIISEHNQAAWRPCTLGQMTRMLGVCNKVKQELKNNRYIAAGRMSVYDAYKELAEKYGLAVRCYPVYIGDTDNVSGFAFDFIDENGVLVQSNEEYTSMSKAQLRSVHETMYCLEQRLNSTNIGLSNSYSRQTIQGCSPQPRIGMVTYSISRLHINEPPYYDTVSWNDGNNHASKDGQRTTDERSKSRGQACLHYALQGERRRKSNRSPLPSNV